MNNVSVDPLVTKP